MGLVIQEGRPSLLTFEEREVCSRIGSGNDLDSQRARALLALDDGATQAGAAAQTGLTLNQVKYCLAQFRRLRLDIFPPQLLADPVDPAEQTAEGRAAAEWIQGSALPEKATVEEKKGKGKKAKKRGTPEEQPKKKNKKTNGKKAKGKKKGAKGPNKGNNGQGGKKSKKKKKK